MLTRREWLQRTVGGTSLLALGTGVPRIFAQTAAAVDRQRDTILVVVELTGGNDGLNTVVPFDNDHYHRARPRLRVPASSVVKLSDTIGLHPSLRPFESFWKQGQLAVVQGIGYPNPDRSHFESMEIWQTADPKRQTGSGWIGRAVGELKAAEGRVPALHVGNRDLPLAVRGSSTGIPSIDLGRSLELRPERASAAGDSASESSDRASRWSVVSDLSRPGDSDGDLTAFVRRTSSQTLATVEQIHRATLENRRDEFRFNRFNAVSATFEARLQLVAQMIEAQLGARLYYLSLEGFDTHAEQTQSHPQLLAQMAGGVQQFFQRLTTSKAADQVVLMTFSEFGRRVAENASAGTDHGAGSCSFVMGPSVKGGLLGKYPSLAPADLDNGDLKHHVDFRQLYQTLLEDWLGRTGAPPFGQNFEKLPLLPSAS